MLNQVSMSFQGVALLCPSFLSVSFLLQQMACDGVPTKCMIQSISVAGRFKEPKQHHDIRGPLQGSPKCRNNANQRGQAATVEPCESSSSTIMPGPAPGGGMGTGGCSCAT